MADLKHAAAALLRQYDEDDPGRYGLPFKEKIEGLRKALRNPHTRTCTKENDRG